MQAQSHSAPAARIPRGHVKCLVWDLDNTLWRGVLAEGDDIELFPWSREIIRALDERGILQSIASRNNAKQALERLRAFGLEEYFLHPQIHWGTKSESIARIAERLNIGIDSLAFVDDQPFELDEVRQRHNSVLCLPAERLPDLLAMPSFNPPHVTAESRLRRQMYLTDQMRNAAEESFEGPTEQFLASLNMVFTITHANEDDLPRLHELTARTNQLNTTGRIYSTAELDAFRKSDKHDLLVARLKDRYGTYGVIGLALIDRTTDHWRLRILLMSCRVMSRGVGSLLLHHIMRGARDAGADLVAEMIPNDRNRMMYATYKFTGFREFAKEGEVHLLRHDLEDVPAIPSHVRLHAPTTLKEPPQAVTATQVNTEHWFVRRPQAHAKVRLFCFSHAGGQPTSFIPWQKALGSSIEVCAVQLPGHGQRFREEPCRNFQALVAALHPAVHALDDLPAVYYGHSLGALLAFEVARKAPTTATSPRRLLLSGCSSPLVRETMDKRLHELHDHALTEELGKYDGTPAEVLADEGLMEMLLPVIRADFALVSDYRYHPGPKLGIPLTIMAGRDDRQVPVESIAGWAEMSSAETETLWFEGGHFFPTSSWPEVLRCLRDRLLPLAEAKTIASSVFTA